MELRELIAEFRDQSGDHGAPPLWDDKRLARLFSEAEREAAERARLLRNRDDADLCSVALLEGVTAYRLHPKVFDIDPHAVTMTRPTTDPAYANRRWPVCLGERIDYERMVAYPLRTGWAERYVLFDEPTGDGFSGITALIDRAPAEDGGTLWFTTYRYPLNDLESPSDEPEIAQQHHMGLVQWALFRAYSTRDVEGSASERAANALALFTEQFGIKVDANVRRKQRRHRAVKSQRECW